MLPISLTILLENVLRHQGDPTVFDARSGKLSFYPSRVLMQDFTGVPALVDLTSLKEVLKRPLSPKIPVDLVIDHSISVDTYGGPESLSQNMKLEFDRNRERYEFLKSQASEYVRILPPGTGICHQVNLEFLATVVCERDGFVYPDTVLGTDSHTTMINGLSVLGWGVGGIEAEACMLGEPYSMIVPKVVGVEVIGSLPEGSTATDAVLTLTQILRNHGVVGKFVEFFGQSLSKLSIPDRATLSNMAPEYGATCAFFPVDEQTLSYLKMTGRKNMSLVESYAKTHGLWHNPKSHPEFDETCVFDLSKIVPTLAGPKRPQDRLGLEDLPKLCVSSSTSKFLKSHDIVIAAITSCTNTSNPHVMMAAGLLAQKANQFGLKVPSHVKTSLAPGSLVVTDYLEQTGVLTDLKALGFFPVGYGCTTCIGNSGPLRSEIEKDIQDHSLNVCSVLSGNRNFEGRIHPLVQMNYLMSPPLVVAFALAGTSNIDLSKDPIGKNQAGNSVYLKDLWPSSKEIQDALNICDFETFFKKRYTLDGDDLWKGVPSQKTYSWNPKSTYIQCPPFATLPPPPATFQAKILAILGDSVTTDHISPAGNILKDTPAWTYLKELGVQDMNSYGSRRGNHHVMVRGTFANRRLQNKMTPDHQGGWTLVDGKICSIFEASESYQKRQIPLMIIAGQEYGTGSSRDWAAKGTALLGVKIVLAKSFERIHRSNLIGMGILPLQFLEDYEFHGDEVVTFEDHVAPKSIVSLRVDKCEIHALCRIDTEVELGYYKAGGILPYVIEKHS